MQQAPPAPGLSEFYQPPASTPFPQFVHGGESPSDFLAATAEPPPPPPLDGGTLPAPLQGALQGALGLLGPASSSSSSMRPPLQGMPARHSASSRGGHHSSDLHKVS